MPNSNMTDFQDTQDEMIHELLRLCLCIGFDTKADIFCDYHSHIQAVDIRGFWKGWGEYFSPDHSITIYLSWDDPLEKLEKEIHYLEGVLRDLKGEKDGE